MTIKAGNTRLDTLLTKFHDGGIPDAADLDWLLTLTEPRDADRLFAAAREIRSRHFGSGVFLYGFIYISTHCRNNCNFCFYRQCNLTSLRYRKEEREILEASALLAEQGVHLIDLTMGEDPRYHNGGETGFGSLESLVEKVKRLGRPVMVSPGVLRETTLGDLAKAGADWYACYQETHNPERFASLRPGQDYDIRLNTKRLAHNRGLLTEEGILVGVGETGAELAETLRVVGNLDCDQVRAMNFVPQKGTPMANYPKPSPLRECLMIALLRLAFPHRLIPATLDVEGLDGLERRLEAGANVVTSIVPPARGLAGVAQSSLDIEAGRRSVQGVREVLAKKQLEIAPLETYLEWMRGRKKSWGKKSWGTTEQLKDNMDPKRDKVG